MAFAATPGTPRVRPTTVNVAVILLYVAAALEIINAIASIASYSAFNNAYKAAYAGTSLANQSSSAAVQVIVTVIISLVLAAIFIVLAFLDGRGNRVGRILTWVFGALALCCTAGAFGLSSFGKSAYDSQRNKDPKLPTYDQLQANIKHALPSWYTPVTTIAGIGVLLAVVVVIILLALPASNPFFRKAAEPQWEPPTPGAGGTYPPAGGTPNYPSTGETPPPPASSDPPYPTS
jgi:hypothetical protein